MFRLGLAVSLFQKSYSELMEAVLYALMSRFFLRTFEKRIVYAQNHCKQVFAKTANATSYVATYLTCLISFALSSLDEIPTTTTILFNIIIVIIKQCGEQWMLCLSTQSIVQVDHLFWCCLSCILYLKSTKIFLSKIMIVIIVVFFLKFKFYQVIINENFFFF